MSDTFWKGHDAMDKKKPDYGTWRSIAAGTIGTGKIKNRSFLDKETDMQTTVDGLMGLMPIGARHVTYLPAQAMEIIESKDFKDNTGFVPMAETVNGRAAMWAFLTGVFAEIGSGDTVMQQFASCPVRRARDRGGL